MNLMRPFHPESGRPGAAARGLALASLLMAGLAFSAPVAAHAEDAPIAPSTPPVEEMPALPEYTAPGYSTPVGTQTFGDCVGDLCDGFQWLGARGADNSGSFWGMDPGHNCTNYVAWKLIRGGIDRPPTNPGNASTWAERAIADGFAVDNVPTVGSVAHWNGGSFGYSSLGHVAYVEQVNADGTIVVSEDFWFGGSQTGELTFRTVDATRVSNFIHYGVPAAVAVAPTMRVTDPISGQWVTTQTGLTPAASTIAALQAGSALEIVLVEEGKLKVASYDASGWQQSDTGLAADGASLAVADMGNGKPYIMAGANGQLVMIVRTSVGWQYMPTGEPLDGSLAAVNIGGLWPTVYSVKDGALQETWGDNQGWHTESTTISASGPVTAAVNKLGWPEVFWVQDGVIQHAWADKLGWQSESLGISTTGTLTAVRVGDSVQVTVADADRVFVVLRDAAGTWTTANLALRPATLTTALGSAEGPRIVQLGG